MSARSGTGSRSIDDPRMRRMCDLAGISQAQGKLADLRAVKKGIDVSLRELDVARTREASVNAQLAAAQFVKASCDAVLKLAAALSSGTAGARATELVEAGYASTAVVVDAAVRSSLGERVNWVDKGLEATRAGTAFIPDSMKDARYLARNALGKAELGVAAVRQDRKAVVAKGVDYAADLAEYTLDQLEESSPDGAKAAKAYIAVARAIFAYDEELRKITDSFLENEDASAERLIASRATFKRLAGHVQGKIDEIEDLLRRCQPARPGPPRVPGRP